MMNNEELKEFRLMLGLTCKEAGDLMYLTKQQISNIETGKSKQKSTMYLMELCYKKYLEDHRRTQKRSGRAWLISGSSLLYFSRSKHSPL